MSWHASLSRSKTLARKSLFGNQATTTTTSTTMVFTCSTAQNHTGVRTHIHTHHVETALQQYEDTCPLLSCACKCIPQVRQVIYQAGCAVLRLRVEGVRPKAHTRFGGGWRGRGGHIVTHDHKKKRMCLTFTVPRLNKILSPVSSSSR